MNELNYFYFQFLSKNVAIHAFCGGKIDFFWNTDVKDLINYKSTANP